ncbi:hypothetical protein JOC75_001113 [Metabacillus crassostreae]|nr:hypothetical protein [Metabacillus crassostreae]
MSSYYSNEPEPDSSNRIVNKESFLKSMDTSKNSLFLWRFF